MMYNTATLQFDPMEQAYRTISGRHLSLSVRTNQGNNPLPLPDIDDTRLVFGRYDPDHPNAVNVDLTDFDARDLGVSRLHAVINNCGIPTLTDMDSANGTYLNGERLLPFETHRLYNGDVICLGMLVLYVTLQ
jgi:pSer/pThr/pTyr-binding forkhead associated (FHA) protein